MDKVYLAEVLRGDNLLLKRMVHDPVFAKVLFKCVDDSREHLKVFLPWVDLMKSYQDELTFLKTSVDKWDNYEGFNYAMIIKETQELIGAIGFHNIDWENERIEIGYWIAKKHEGKGYISKALKLIEKEAFEKGFHRLEILCDEVNSRSAAVPLRNGYTQEGRLLDHTKVGDAYRNMLIFSKRNEVHPIGLD